jgi:hypothetical protein
MAGENGPSLQLEPLDSLALIPAKNLPPPTHGGRGPQPLPFIPFNASDYALAKAAANTKIGIAAKGGGRPGGGGGGGGSSGLCTNLTPCFNGIYNTGLTPPDTTGAIGFDRYIEVVNSVYGIYDLTGAKINSGSFYNLAGVSPLYGLSDPQIIFDVKTQRFYYAGVAYDSSFTQNYIVMGWSKNSSPKSYSDFCQYAIATNSTLADFPKLGDTRDFLLVGYNGFLIDTFWGFVIGETYTGSQFVAMNKPPAGQTCAPTSGFLAYDSGTLFNGDGNMASTPVPANLVDDDSTTTGDGYVLANADLTDLTHYPDGADFVSVYKVYTSGSNPTTNIPIPGISPVMNVTVTPANLKYSIPPDAPQKDIGAPSLDTMDGRFTAAVAAIDPVNNNSNIALWTAHAVYGGARSEVRWYEIDPNVAALVQSGKVSDSSLFVFNGTVSPDRNGFTHAFGGGMVGNVNTSSSSDYPAIQFVTKKGGNAQSLMTKVVQSTASDIDPSCFDTGTCRWGDYSGASPDPNKNATTGKVWLTNQYVVPSTDVNSTNWRTWVYGVTP